MPSLVLLPVFCIHCPKVFVCPCVLSWIWTNDPRFSDISQAGSWSSVSTRVPDGWSTSSSNATTTAVQPGLTFIRWRRCVSQDIDGAVTPAGDRLGQSLLFSCTLGVGGDGPGSAPQPVVPTPKDKSGAPPVRSIHDDLINATTPLSAHRQVSKRSKKLWKTYCNKLSTIMSISSVFCSFIMIIQSSCIAAVWFQLAMSHCRAQVWKLSLKNELHSYF